MQYVSNKYEISYVDIHDVSLCLNISYTLIHPFICVFVFLWKVDQFNTTSTIHQSYHPSVECAPRHVAHVPPHNARVWCHHWSWRGQSWPWPLRANASIGHILDGISLARWKFQRGSRFLAPLCKLIEGWPGFFKSFGQIKSNHLSSLQPYWIFCRIFLSTSFGWSSTNVAVCSLHFFFFFAVWDSTTRSKVNSSTTLSIHNIGIHGIQQNSPAGGGDHGEISRMKMALDVSLVNILSVFCSRLRSTSSWSPCKFWYLQNRTWQATKCYCGTTQKERPASPPELLRNPSTLAFLDDFIHIYIYMGLVNSKKQKTTIPSSNVVYSTPFDVFLYQQ